MIAEQRTIIFETSRGFSDEEEYVKMHVHYAKCSKHNTENKVQMERGEPYCRVQQSTKHSCVTSRLYSPISVASAVSMCLRCER